MRAYQVSVQPNGEIIRFAIATTQADARIKRDELISGMEGIKKKDVIIEGLDIPTGKSDLIEFINGVINDAYDCGQSNPDV